ncbi:MAG: regulatory protein RecX [Microbacteriaceae bacterium]|nr:MAG: regulatory protein RecX [Microbacteriaceae bacterium]
MIVRFPSASDSEGGQDAKAGRERTAGIAPVAYLPGAQPNAKAAQTLQQVGRQHVGQNRSGDAAARSSKRAANVSIHQLARRGMSRWELRQVLEKRDVADEVATAELDRLERVGLLDDAALAVTLVYTQHTRKGLGRQAIAHELKRRHIDQGIIDDALSEIEDDDERERALQLAHKRVGQVSAVDDETARRRLTGFLARKGYSAEIIRAAVDSAMSTRRSGVRFQ